MLLCASIIVIGPLGADEGAVGALGATGAYGLTD